jgi:hypothetical protein
MTVLSCIEATSTRRRVYAVKCSVCSKDIFVQQVTQLQRHVDCATHVSALESGRAPEHKVDAWIRDHGEASTMTLVSNEMLASDTRRARRVLVVKCDARRTEIRAPGLKPLLSHVGSATHVSPLEYGRAPERKIDT